MIFYEAPHKLLGTLNDLVETFGAERRVSLSREMTKLHEQTLRTTLGGGCEAVLLPAEQKPGESYRIVC